MAAQIQRAIVKGRIAGVVATRNMFVAQVDVVPADTRWGVWLGYLALIYDHLQPYISTVFHVESVELQKYDLGEYEFLEEGAWNWAGTGTGDYHPNSVAVVLIGKAIGKRLMGRKFFSAITEAATDANSLITAALAAAASAALDYTALFTSTNGSTLGPGIIDKTGAFHTFWSGIVSSLLGSMRRRKPGLGI